ncbi:MAG: GNAT family N-acetyltransferase [Solirubrobacteraceae bacterium]
MATVAAAFAQDPAWAFMLGDEYERLAPQFAGALFDARLVSGGVWVTDDLAAVAMWDPPDRSEAAVAHAQRVRARYRDLAGEAVFARHTRYDAAVARASAAGRHWYLGVLATEVSRRGQGLASALIAPVLEEAARLCLPCCLETSTTANRRFYERRGFTQATDVLLRGGPPTWWLRRDPPSATGRFAG